MLFTQVIFCDHFNILQKAFIDSEQLGSEFLYGKMRRRKQSSYLIAAFFAAESTPLFAVEFLSNASRSSNNFTFLITLLLLEKNFINKKNPTLLENGRF